MHVPRNPCGARMMLDVPTALAIMAFASMVAGTLLTISWLQHRDIPALFPWALAFLLAALGVKLMAARGAVPDLWSIAVANAIVALAYGCMWNGARIFAGRSSRVLAASAGAIIWLVACSSNDFFASPRDRLLLSTAIAIVYSILTVIELWPAKQERLASRWLIVGLLIAHTAALPVRLPLAGSLAHDEFTHFDLLAFVMLESVLLSMCGAYLFGSLAKERIAHSYKRDALVDPLTGIANRRAFLKHGTRIVHRCRLARQPVALLLLDLDHFKSVNDRYGHNVGDGVLITFCRVVEENLRPTDLFARLGGEELVCLLAGTRSLDAFAAAERVRLAFETARHKVADGPLATTVSVGIAASDDADTDLPALMREADAALYLAKRNGRNRVELARAAETATAPT